MIAIIDYDAGNIKSVEKALHFLGQEAVVTGDKETILSAEKVILPGVGAFGDAMNTIRERRLESVIHRVVEQGTPFLEYVWAFSCSLNAARKLPGQKAWGF